MTVPAVPDLVARILQAIERAERIAQAAEGDHVFDGTGIVVHHHHDPQFRRTAMLSSTVAIHIAHNRPAAVLRRCAADRRTVERHSRPGRYEYDGARVIPERWWCAYCGAPMPCPDLLDRAEVYDLIEEATTS